MAAGLQGGTVFIGEYSDSKGSPASGVFVRTASGTVKAVATTTGGNFVGFSSASIDAKAAASSSSSKPGDLSRQVVFAGESASGTTGIWAAAAPASGSSKVVPKLVLAAGGKVPGTTAPMTCISAPVVRRSTIAFFGSSCDGVTRQSRQERMCRTKRSPFHTIHDAESNLQAGIFLLRPPANSMDEEEEEEEEKSGGANGGSASTTTIDVVASFGTPVPGANVGGSDGGGGRRGTDKTVEHFVAFSDPVISDDVVAFVAETSAGTLGVYAYTLSTSALGLVADTNTPLPGGSPQGNFTDFPNPPAAAGTSVAFYGAGGASSGGVYMKDSTGTIRALVTQADQIDGEEISYIGFAGPDSFDGRTAAFYAVTNTTLVATATAADESAADAAAGKEGRAGNDASVA
eukprot:g1519.t1